MKLRRSFSAIGKSLSSKSWLDSRSPFTVAFSSGVDDVEKLTGIDFFPALPDDEEAALEASFDVSLWDISDFSRTSTARRYGYDLDSASYSGDSAAVSEAKPEGFRETVLYFLYVNFGSLKVSALDFLDSLAGNFTSR